MTSREAILYNIRKMKGQPLKKQIQYILGNFWIPIVAVLAAVITLISLLIHWTTLKSTALTLSCINSGADFEVVEDYVQGFAEAQGIDMEEYDLITQFVYLNQGADTDYQSAQVFSAMLMAGDLDVLAADRETILIYGYRGAFTDLSEVLTQAQMESLAPHFLYIDGSILENVSLQTAMDTLCPDPTKPEEMEQPIPVAIVLQPEWDFTQIYSPYAYSEDAIALFASSKNTANAQAFLQYILEQKGN